MPGLQCQSSCHAQAHRYKFRHRQTCMHTDMHTHSCHRQTGRDQVDRHTDRQAETDKHSSQTDMNTIQMKHISPRTGRVIVDLCNQSKAHQVSLRKVSKQSQSNQTQHYHSLNLGGVSSMNAIENCGCLPDSMPARLKPDGAPADGLAGWLKGVADSDLLSPEVQGKAP